MRTFLLSFSRKRIASHRNKDAISRIQVFILLRLGKHHSCMVEERGEKKKAVKDRQTKTHQQIDRHVDTHTERQIES